MRAYVRDWIDLFDDFRIEPIELIDAGENTVVAILRLADVPTSARSRRGEVPAQRSPVPVVSLGAIGTPGSGQFQALPL